MQTDGREYIYNQPLEVCRFVEQAIGHDVHFYGYLGIGMKRKGEWLAAVLYDRFGVRDCEMHIGSVRGTRWATDEAISRALSYAFVDLRRERITGCTPAHNLDARKFNEHIGFVQEGIKRCGADDGSDAILYGMLRSECRWIKDWNHAA